MTAQLLHAPDTDEPEQQIVGTTTSGSTESILLAMKTYRDGARAEKRITEPEVIAPETAHPASDKAAHLFGIKLIRTPVGDDFKAKLKPMENALTRNTIAIVGSAPGYPHGVIDPIPQMAAIAQQYGLGTHLAAVSRRGGRGAKTLFGRAVRLSIQKTAGQAWGAPTHNPSPAGCEGEGR